MANGSTMTVFGLLTAGGARRVRATVSNGLEAERVAVPPQPIAVGGNRPTGLRFAVIALSGKRCFEQLSIVGPGGRRLWKGTPTEYGCDPSSPEAPE